MSALVTRSHVSCCQTRRAQFEQSSQLVVSEVVVLFPGQRMAKSSIRSPNLVVEPGLLPRLMNLCWEVSFTFPISILFQRDASGITENSERWLQRPVLYYSNSNAIAIVIQSMIWLIQRSIVAIMYTQREIWSHNGKAKEISCHQ